MTIKEPNTNPELVGVRFQPAGKIYHFHTLPEIALAVGDWVVVETIYGDQIGHVACFATCAPEEKPEDGVKRVLRRANGLDMAQHQVMQDRAAKAMQAAKEDVAEMKLDVKVVSVEFTLDGACALLLCTGNLNKPDIAQLRRRLGRRLNCRVELRNVGPRDQAKALGGYGVCGEPLCCARFLAEFDAVSIRMAKDQSVSMAPSDITGMCGRLRCCLAYEHQAYKDASKGFPKLKSRVQTEKGIGRVIDWDILKGQIIVEIPPDGPRFEREKFRFNVDEVQVVQASAAAEPEEEPEILEDEE